MYNYVEFPFEVIKQKVITLMKIIGVNDVDNTLLEFNYNVELERLLNSINEFKLQEGLVNTLTYRVFASLLKNMLVLTDFSLLKSIDLSNLTRVVSMKEYETDIKFGADETLKAKQDGLLKYLTKLQDYGQKELYRYRRFTWR